MDPQATHNSLFRPLLGGPTLYFVLPIHNFLAPLHSTTTQFLSHYKKKARDASTGAASTSRTSAPPLDPSSSGAQPPCTMAQPPASPSLPPPRGLAEIPAASRGAYGSALAGSGGSRPPRGGGVPADWLRPRPPPPDGKAELANGGKVPDPPGRGEGLEAARQLSWSQAA